ncbi:hypothetical protein BDV24DRAFT_169456 [Aspergillus arachidicola]|uniref:Uncharacterized protein n=1 Tax=Aspergillus arachidicola TaxID=656916 RepID=A0A5N6XUE4_9EURO|nr:hypothetical protein BDV24DRAFT_169456 [Aspergillus arachidicola]
MRNTSCCLQQNISRQDNSPTYRDTSAVDRTQYHPPTDPPENVYRALLPLLEDRSPPPVEATSEESVKESVPESTTAETAAETKESEQPAEKVSEPAAKNETVPPFTLDLEGDISHYPVELMRTGLRDT